MRRGSLSKPRMGESELANGKVEPEQATGSGESLRAMRRLESSKPRSAVLPADEEGGSSSAYDAVSA